MTMEWLDQHFKELDGFPRPNWEAIYEDVDKNFKELEQHDLWCDIARSWMGRLTSRLPSNYSIHESENFILVAAESDKYVTLFQEFLERTLKKILSTLPNIASDNGFGKHVVLLFDNIDHYYSYIFHFYSDDREYGLSAGVYLNNGYGHFAIPHQELNYVESTASHEMTHALVSHLPIPAWLNEGMAVSIENLLTGSAPLEMNNEIFAEHQSFWGEEEIQEFWSGDAFSRSDEGQKLSYHLAQFAVNALSKDYDSFVEFANKAHYSDGGESAAKEVYEGSLGNLISQFFGEGEWGPKSETWPEKDTSAMIDK